MRKLIFCLYVMVLGDLNLLAAEGKGIPDFEWMKQVGAKTFPVTGRVFYVNDHGAVGDALTDCTRAIQKTIDACAEAGGGKVSFHPGIYLSGSVFIRSNVNFEIPKGAMIVGSQDISDYERIDTRVAGVEMEWPAGIVNIIGQKNAAITGDGVIHGRGKVFWDKYREMRREYDPKGLRWIVDYDCERPQGIIISDCEHITVKDIVIYQPGFWSMHILYSSNVTVDGVIISNNIEGRGPSTDGIDIDSSSHILVQNCNINCNDDNFCLKAGRDSDGLRVNRPTEYVVIRDCVAGHGDGLFTCGSETSGGIRNIVAYNLKGIGTKYGLRFKSTVQRGGVIENIYLSNIVMDGVRDPFVVDLNWHPTYSTSVLPDEYDPEKIPVHWKKMLTPVSPEQGTPKFRNIRFENVHAVNAGTCVKVGGIKNSTVDGFSFENVSFKGKNAGSISWANDWTFKNFSVTGTGQQSIKITDCRNVNP